MILYFTERSSRMIYEARPLGDTDVVVRPATPGLECMIEKMNLPEFVNRFEEYAGDPTFIAG